MILTEATDADRALPVHLIKILCVFADYSSQFSKNWGYQQRLPPLPEQHEIVRRVETLFAYADRIEAQAKAALERANHLTQSILAKAFRGEFTEKWRMENAELITGDNSAEALLARIQFERAAQPPNKRFNRR